MKDAHVACRASVCLIALIVVFALPAGAQTRPLQEVDQAVAQQQGAIKELKDANQALRQELEDIKKARAAPAVAWVALGIVGLFSVLMWGGITITRERARMHETDVDRQQKITEAIGEQVRLIDDAANARITILTELLREARTPPASPATAKEKHPILEFVEMFTGPRKSSR